MKMHILVVLLGAAIAATASARGHSGSSSRASGPVYVKSHVTKNGTYVPSHVRTAPNSSKYDNYSTKGNVNPYTGKDGTKDPYSK